MLTVLAQALHRPPTSDEAWASSAVSWPAAGKFGAFEGDAPIGVASSFVTEMLVPGGRRVTAAAVDGVGVRADRIRRGVLTALMGAQLDDLAARGVVLASLHASEATIYGRFGYGVAVLGKTLHVERPAARFREGVRAGGEVRLLTADEAVKEIPGLCGRIGLFRPGMITRPPGWWSPSHDKYVTAPQPHRVAVHSGPDGDDGYVLYRALDQRTPNLGALLEVRYLHAANPLAVDGLWRFLLSVDLVSAVLARDRPMDEHVDTLLDRPSGLPHDGGPGPPVLRLVDVAAALEARSYTPAAPVMLDVVDRQLPGNNGRYVVGPDGACRTGEPAGLRLDVEALAMLYLGEWRASTLDRAGRIEVLDQDALGRADELFRTSARPWNGTYF
ncbi:GNAT family N-acetyltransferase [Amycolatopsis sp. H20-H5]|uniref:GNAT family N-acetyltransferase n=1 Tax=Amycolatopsis sp. H20-H5 TaxID=3046309 RepID=UPI002DBFA5A4|nr:GNAT family N-acetyltransferase [Amycolatopsis sp. H20-H5]MEC3979360.1 GNAT family N-acetyltransferase [Amycolatopsis sp. H20-H5]